MYHIVVEGLDGSGKSSIIKELKYLIESRMGLTVNPEHGPSNVYEDISLGDIESHETKAYRLLGIIGSFCDKMKEEDYDVLISDRHYYSTEFYQGIKSLLNKHIPDLVIYVQINGETFFERNTKKDVDIFVKQKGVLRSNLSADIMDYFEGKFRQIIWRHHNLTKVPVLFIDGAEPISYNANRAFYRFVERVDEIEQRYY